MFYMGHLIMGHDSLVYGCIHGSRWRQEDMRRLQRINRDVIARLPKTDVWPFLTRAMFAHSTLWTADDIAHPAQTAVHGVYRLDAIHFGATFKEIEWQWDEWLVKFERLLAELFWDTVYLHLKTDGTVGNYDYVYRPLDQIERFLSDPPQPATQWTFTGGPRTFQFHGGAIDANAITNIWSYDNGIWMIT